MSASERSQFALPVGCLLSDAGELSIGVDLIVPPAARTLLVCVPGGGMMRTYFDLDTPDGRYSFARAMAARGHAIAMLDPLGIGESSSPEDGFSLHPLVHGLAIARAATALGERTGLTMIGVGHSMGGMFVSLAQIDKAGGHPFAALALLGAGPVGLDWALNDVERGYAHRPEELLGAVEGLARSRYDSGYHPLSRQQHSGLIYGGKGDREAVTALKAVRAPMLGTSAVFSTIPGGWAPHAAQIDVPLFLAVGELDMLGAHDLPRWFPAANDITLVTLAATGHSHFVFPTVDRLFDRMDSWLRGLTQ